MAGSRGPGSRGPVLAWDEYRAAARWLPEARMAAGLSQAELGARLGWSDGWVALRETGAVRMTQAEVEQIAAAIGADVPVLSQAGGAR